MQHFGTLYSLYSDFLYVKLKEIVSGSRRAFQIWATMSRSRVIDAGVTEFFIEHTLQPNVSGDQIGSQNWNWVAILLGNQK